MIAKVFERFVSLRRVPLRIVVVTALASYVLQLGAIVQGQPLYIIALYTLLPWIPLFFFEGLWKVEHYNWVAIFAIVTALQVGHIGEHTFQVVQLGLLNGTVDQACPPPVDNEDNARMAMNTQLRTPNQRASGISSSQIVQTKTKVDGLPKLDSNGNQVVGPAACGVFGQLDFETVHLVWDTLVWIGALVLLVKFPGNIWLWIAMFAASTHEVEHLFLGWIYFVETTPIYNYARQLWATTLSGNIVTAHPVGLVRELSTFYDVGGKTGIMGQNGLVETLLGSKGQFLIRPFLHFGYNSLVVLPTVIAFFWQLRRIYDEYLAKVFPNLNETQLIEATSKLEYQKILPGQTILRQGDSANQFYIIAKGVVEEIRRMPNGIERQLGRLQAGQCFGHIGLLHGGKNITTARAASNVELLSLDRESFLALLSKSEASQQDLDLGVRKIISEIHALQSTG